MLSYRTINGVEAGSALLVVMIALKVLESKGRRDQLVLIMLSYFLLFASLLTARGPFTGIYLLLLVWLTTIGLLQLSRRGPLLPMRSTGALAGRLLLQSLPLMLALFVLFPRLPGPLWAIQGTSTSATSGLGDTVNPGDITSLALTDEIAFRAEFLSPPPPARDLYWRGPTMTNFDGRTWSMSIGDRRNVAATIEYLGAPTEYRVMLETNGPQLGVRARDAEARSRRAAAADGQRLSASYVPRNPARHASRLHVDLVHAFSRARAARRERARDVPQAPAGKQPADARARTKLARRQPETRASDRARRWTICALSRSSTRSRLPALGDQPVDEFLFDTREGFCEHYASAFTVMMRAAGLPARVVTGYQGGELNGVGGYYIIRQSDAHAWTEVWLEGRGWVRVDPVSAVAPERVALGSWRSALAGERVPGSALRRLEWVRRALLVWDAAATYWNEWVIGYGPQLQRGLLDALGLDSPAGSERWSKLLLLCVGAMLAGSLLVTLQLAWRRRRRTPVDEAARQLTAFTRRLARLDVAPRALTEGPAAYAARAQSRLPHAAADIGAIVSAYLRARYERDSDRSALAELRARVASFRAARA